MAENKSQEEIKSILLGDICKAFSTLEKNCDSLEKKGKDISKQESLLLSMAVTISNNYISGLVQ